MTESSQPSEDAVLRSFAVYQDALVRIADIARRGDSAGTLAKPVTEICYQAHREVAAILSPAQAHPDSDEGEPQTDAAA
ncbi:MAG: hypothetical protein GX644_12805 [Limnobacter sp.]|nr:hypothetical protein [Limnobacter sp.]